MDIRDAIKKVVNNKYKEPVASYKMTFDSQQAQLEPIYYWILDFINDTGWKKVQKVTDNFMSSPGSGQFAEMGQRQTRLQEEGMKILGGLNQVIKSVLNLIYDLKEFEMRLAHYDDVKSDDPIKKEQGMLALKQIWLDNVDLKRGRGSIHQMAGELGFTTIREAFMMANSVEDLKKMNKDEEGGLINDQVMRILIPRTSEFLKWVDYSEKELRKRMNIEKSYLKSQVETVKLYSSWMKPYLQSAEELRQKGFDGNAALVNAFSTSMFELVLFAQKDAEPLKALSGYNLKRTYHGVIIVGLKYRGHVSQRVTQKGDYAYAMGGRVDMTFDAYALNSEEITLVRKEMEKSDVLDGAKFSLNVAEESLLELQEDLKHFLGEGKKKEEKKEEKKSEDINPFKALFGGDLFKKKEVKAEKKEINSSDDIKKDNYVETTARLAAAEKAASGLYTIYDIYKKAHGMASAPGEGFENSGLTRAQWERKLEQGPGVKFKDSWRKNFDKF